MAKKLFEDGTWLVQVQRVGKRKSQRGSGGEKAASQAEEKLIAELQQEIELERAANLLGVQMAPNEATSTASAPLPTLREYFENRWVSHARVVQNEQTRRTTQTPFRYLLFYLGDERLDALLSPQKVNYFVEKMKETGPISFRLRRDGTPRKRKCEELSNSTINKSLQCLQALLNLAHAEGDLPAPPRVDMLPNDDSEPVVPPSDEQYQALLKASEQFREVAPLLPEVTKFAAETGLRRGEIFNLTFRSVDVARKCIRVEMQPKVRIVNGKPWKPKHLKWREVPLSECASEILDARKKAGPSQPDDLVFPNRGGAPYDRMDRAPEAAGKGYFFDAVELAGLKGVVTFHSLRHYFAVTLLVEGAQISVVSEYLGHSDINLTIKRYGRFSRDAKVKWDVIKLLDRKRSRTDADQPPPASESP